MFWGREESTPEYAKLFYCSAHGILAQCSVQKTLNNTNQDFYRTWHFLYTIPYLEHMKSTQGMTLWLPFTQYLLGVGKNHHCPYIQFISSVDYASQGQNIGHGVRTPPSEF